MSHVSSQATWTVPQADFAALRITATTFLAQQGMQWEVQDGGKLLGRQGSAIVACLFLIWFAPTRILPKKAWIELRQEANQVAVQARIEDNFPLFKISSVAGARYERYFTTWLQRLRGHFLPAPIVGTFVDEDGETPALSPAVANNQNPDTDLQTQEPDVHAKNAASSNGRRRTYEFLTHRLLRRKDQGPDGTRTALQLRFKRPTLKGVMRKLSGKGSETSPTSTGLPEAVRRELLEGDALFQAGSWEAALRRYDSAVSALQAAVLADHSLSAVVAQIYFRRGLAYFNHSQERLNVSPGASVSQVHSASDLHIAMALVKQGIADQSEALRLDPKFALAYNSRGNAYAHLAQCERAIKGFTKAAIDFTYAINDFTQATELDRSFALAYANRALAYAQLNEYSEAEADTETAISLGYDRGQLETALHVAKSLHEPKN